MTPARRRTMLFLICAVVLLAAGFASGYAYSYSDFYSAEAQLDHELIEMDFNIRQLYYANMDRRVDCRRELVQQLKGQVAFVNKMLATAPETKNRSTAQTSVRQAENVIRGDPIVTTVR